MSLKNWIVTICGGIAVILLSAVVALTFAWPLGSGAQGPTLISPDNRRDDDGDAADGLPAIPRDLWALDTDNTLHLRRACRQRFQRELRVRPFSPGEVLIGIDFRPTDNQLTAVSNTGNLYIISTAPGQRGNLVLLPTPLNPNFPGGFQSLVDFNPLLLGGANPLRLIASGGLNYAVVGANLNTVAVQTATTYTAGDVNAGKPATISGGAYTNALPGATSTILYALDSNFHTLVTPLVVNGNSATGGGQFQTIGRLKTPSGAFLTLTPLADLDIYSITASSSILNYAVGVSGHTLFFIDAANLPAPGQRQDVPIQTGRIAASDVIDIAVSTVGQGACGRAK